MKKLTFSLLLTQAALAVSALLAGCSKDEEPAENIYNTRGIAAAINNNFSLTLFAWTVQATNHTALLTQSGPFMVLAPSNTALNAIGIKTQQNISNAITDLAMMVPYHIYPQSLPLDSLPIRFNQEFRMKNNLTLYISRWQNTRDTATTVNGVRLEGKGLKTTNGLIYVVEKVLRPTVAGNLQDVVGGDARLTFFNAAVQRSGLTSLVTSSEEHTVFAPVNDAFIKIGIKSTDSIYKMEPAVLQQMLQGHVVAARRFLYDYIALADVAGNEYGETMIDNTAMRVRLQADSRLGRFKVASLQKTTAGVSRSATFLGEDVTASNGVVHLINTILTP